MVQPEKTGTDDHEEPQNEIASTVEYEQPQAGLAGDEDPPTSDGINFKVFVLCAFLKFVTSISH